MHIFQTADSIYIFFQNTTFNLEIMLVVDHCLKILLI